MNTDKDNIFTRFIISAVTVLVILLAVLPSAEILLRHIFTAGLSGSYALIRHTVLWLALLGSYLTAKDRRHLAIEAGVKYLPERFKEKISAFSRCVTIVVLTVYFFSSVSFVFLAFSSSDTIGMLNTRFLVFIIPFGFLIMCINEIYVMLKGKGEIYLKILTILIPLLTGIFFSVYPLSNFLYATFNSVPEIINNLVDFFSSLTGVIKIPLVILLMLAGIFGTPIFIVLGGITYILLAGSGGYTEIAVNEIYSVLTGNMIPAIPLFTLTGFILSESRAGERMIDFFRKAFGWFPGGIIVASICISAFFTTFTGASGVTILAIGGILYLILDKYGVDKKFRTGLLTSSGSIGLLFPPSLPIIMYGIIANLDIKSLFIAGIVPGFLLVLSLSAAGIAYTRKHKIKTERCDLKGIIKSIGNTYWELLLPLIILVSYFSGFTTLVETGAVAVVYILFVETVIYREIDLAKLVSIVKKSVPVIGGILIILGMSKAFSFYLIDEMIPQKLSDFISARISSKIIFLILLNLFLLATGCVMDIFSAIVVVVPLIVPLGEIYGINPVHLGIIFLANLELGYLTPPVGLNLFLSSYRFEQPLEDVYMSVIPFFIIMLIAVILITFIPQLSLFFL